MASLSRQAMPKCKPDLQSLLAQAGKEPRSEVAKRSLQELYLELRDDVLPACIAALDKYKIPYSRMSPRDLRSQLFARLHQSAPRFTPQPHLSDDKARSLVLAWITKPAMWIAADESNALAEELAFEIDARGALAAYCSVHPTPTEDEEEQIELACTGVDKYIAQLSAKARRVLIVYATHLERVRVTPSRQAPHGEPRSEEVARRAARWEWRIPDGGWKLIGDELKMNPAAARKAVQRAVKRLEEVCCNADPNWSHLARPGD